GSCRPADLGAAAEPPRASIRSGATRTLVESCNPWCERGDSNSHGLPHWNLNPARLPVPPLSHAAAIIPADAAAGGTRSEPLGGRARARREATASTTLRGRAARP